MVDAAGRFLYKVFLEANAADLHSQFVAEGPPKGIVSKIVQVAHIEVSVLFKGENGCLRISNAGISHTDLIY